MPYGPRGPHGARWRPPHGIAVRQKTDAPADEHPVEPDRVGVHEIYDRKARVDDDVGQQVNLEALVLQQPVHFGLRPLIRCGVCTGFSRLALRILLLIAGRGIGTAAFTRTFNQMQPNLLGVDRTWALGEPQ
jgi:hypothetical protein